MNDSTNFVFFPKSVGFWQIGGPQGLHIAMTKKPSRLQIFMHKILLGWEWRDVPEVEETA